MGIKLPDNTRSMRRFRNEKKRKKAGRRIDAQTKIEYNLWVTRQDDSGRGGTFAWGKFGLHRAG